MKKELKELHMSTYLPYLLLQLKSLMLLSNWNYFFFEILVAIVCIYKPVTNNSLITTGMEFQNSRQTFTHVGKLPDQEQIQEHFINFNTLIHEVKLTI